MSELKVKTYMEVSKNLWMDALADGQTNEPSHEKMNNLGFRPGLTQTTNWPVQSQK